MIEDITIKAEMSMKTSKVCVTEIIVDSIKQLSYNLTNYINETPIAIGDMWNNPHDFVQLMKESNTKFSIVPARYA